MGKSKATAITTPPDPCWYMDKNTFAVSKEKIGYRYESFVPSIALTDGTSYWLLVVEYTSGNSFGRDPELHYEIIDAYPDSKAAFDNGNKIKEHASRSHYSTSGKNSLLEIEYANGRDYGYASWEGYFERVERIFVKRFVAAELPDFVEIV